MNLERNCIVYQDGRFLLGRRDGQPFLQADGKQYLLSCHPYEPCLYIRDEAGRLAVIHNAFDPDAVLALLAEGRRFSSISGREYDGADFCRLVCFAAGLGNVGIEAAERVFAGEAKRKSPATKTASDNPAFFPGGEAPASPPRCTYVRADPFLDLLAQYPDSAVCFFLVRVEPPQGGLWVHRQALALAFESMYDAWDPQGNWQWDLNRASARRIGAAEFFSDRPEAEGMSYPRAFLDPPHGNAYTAEDFQRLNAALFPRGTEDLELFDWSTDWSDFFDAGHEWWGTLCVTVYDPKLGRVAVILASDTD